MDVREGGSIGSRPFMRDNLVRVGAMFFWGRAGGAAQSLEILSLTAA